MMVLMLPLELRGNVLINGNPFICAHVQVITKEWNFLWLWWKINERLVYRESKIEVAQGSFLPLNMCSHFNLSFHSISHMNYGLLDDMEFLFRLYKSSTHSDLHLYISIQTTIFGCQLANAVGLKAMINYE